jgi:hypothetical protein
MEDSQNDKYVINVGTLSSTTGVYTTVGRSISILRAEVSKGSKPSIVWNFRDLTFGRIDLTALVSILTLAKGVRKFMGVPGTAVMDWNPQLVKQLLSLEFFRVAKQFDLFNWVPDVVGGSSPIGVHPNSKIIFFEKGTPRNILDFDSEDSLNGWKEASRESIEHEIHRRLQGILWGANGSANVDDNTVRIITRTCAELAVNSLLHGNDNPIVGFQRIRGRIKVCVSDAGKGFLKGMNENQAWAKVVNLSNNSDAILNASLMKKHEIGLRLAIDSVVRQGGYVIISSGHTLFHWKAGLWETALLEFNHDQYHESLQTADEILGTPELDFIDAEKYQSGFYREFRDSLVGTRITFELPV